MLYYGAAAGGVRAAATQAGSLPVLCNSGGPALRLRLEPSLSLPVTRTVTRTRSQQQSRYYIWNPQKSKILGIYQVTVYTGHMPV